MAIMSPARYVSVVREEPSYHVFESSSDPQQLLYFALSRTSLQSFTVHGDETVDFFPWSSLSSLKIKPGKKELVLKTTGGLKRRYKPLDKSVATLRAFKKDVAAVVPLARQPRNYRLTRSTKYRIQFNYDKLPEEVKNDIEQAIVQRQPEAEVTTPETTKTPPKMSLYRWNESVAMVFPPSYASPNPFSS